MENSNRTSSAALVHALAGGLSTLVAAAALAGGAILMQAPSGRALGLDVALLRDSPFTDFRVPGALLFVIIGGLATLSALAQGVGTAAASSYTGIAGVTLVGFVVGERILLDGESFLQPVSLGIGVMLAFLGLLGRVVRDDAVITDERPERAPAQGRTRPAAAH